MARPAIEGQVLSARPGRVSGLLGFGCCLLDEGGNTYVLVGARRRGVVPKSTDFGVLLPPMPLPFVALRLLI